jgi:hypothetical protein
MLPTVPHFMMLLPTVLTMTSGPTTATGEV